MNNKIIYYDVTQLVHWSGFVAGIPRVMYELAVRFKASNDNVVFVSWVKEIRSYCVVDFNAYLDCRGLVYITDLPKRSINNMVDEISANNSRFTINRVAKAAIYRTKYLNKDLPNKINTKIVTFKSKKYIKPDIKKGDIVFIPWGEWWDNNFLTMLEDKVSIGAKVTTIIHDIGPMVTPHLSGHSTDSLAEYCKRIVPKCNVVFTVSNNTKKDLTEWLKSHNLLIPTIRVIRLGDSIKVTKPIKPKDDNFINSRLKGKDYILSVGTVEIKKNHMLLYYVYKLANSRDVKLPKLVIVGRRGWKAETTLNLIAQDPETNKQIIVLNNTSDEELAWLYDNCLLTITPSMYEGWGIPIAESVAKGVPTLSSGVSSMVEIAPGIVRHFNPYSTDDCLNVITNSLEARNYKKITINTKEYIHISWNDTYRQVTNVLEGLNG